MKLLIVESPSKAKTIEKYLSDLPGADRDHYVVRASVGHIRDLPKSSKKAIDIEAGFVPFYEVSKGKEKVIRELSTLAKKANSIVLATDPDREGEAIAWHIAESLKLGTKGARYLGKDYSRVTFNEITKEAIEEALTHPRDIDMNLKTAQEARRVLDRLFGYDLSGLIWKKVRYGLSAGRVQSPALRILMEKEREIRAFMPEKYWVISGLFKTLKKDEITLNCSNEPKTQEESDRIIALAEKNEWFVKDIKESEQKRQPRAPFTTSTLQQSASSRLGFSPSRTMQTAQRLYESGHITYMRTDSTNLSKQAQTDIVKLVEKKYGREYSEARVYKTKSKNAQEAHEAIRPTHVDVLSAGLADEQKKLYRLIWERAVSSQMTDAKVLKTKVSANIKDDLVAKLPSQDQLGSFATKFNAIPDFTANGSRILFPGWLAVDTTAQGEDVELTKMEIGEKLDLLKLNSEEKQTEPPHRYTEAGLVKELESRGIGRPSTYASIMSTIEARGYVRKEGRTLFPTDTGEVVSDFVEQNFEKYISDTFTAEMEDELDEIAEGKREYLKTMKDFYGPFHKDIQEKDKMEKVTNLGEADPTMRCPKCDGNMIIKLSKNGKFLSCALYPDCDGARTIEGKEIEGPKETGKQCPLCGINPEAGSKKKNQSGKLVIREGRFGTFISCSRYPKCKYIEKDEEAEKKKMTDIQCTTCKKGFMMERRGRFGIFYSCSDYPSCKNAIKTKPTGRICDMCGSLMMDGTKTIPERCSNKGCPMHNPHKLDKKE